MINADIEKVIATGRSKLGTTERPMYSNRTEFGAWYGMDGVAWCAIYISWVFWHAGYGLPRIRTEKGFALVADIVVWAKKDRSWRPVGNYKPKRGDIVVFSMGGKRPDHAGIVQGLLNDERVHTLEGNTNGGGSRTGGKVAELHRSSKIIGYVEVTPIRAAIDWAAVRRMAAGKLRIDMGSAPNMDGNTKPSCYVAALQQTLNLLSGSNLAENGVYDDATIRAVWNFQKFINALSMGAITDFPGACHDSTRFWLCLSLENVRDGKA